MEQTARVLLAEDDPQLGGLVADALEDEGYQVQWCRNGQEAIEAFDKSKFDICLLDVVMPVKDGFTVAKKIRQQSDLVPIIFISTRALIEDKIEGYSRGADDYVVKPFNMQELLLKMDVFLRRSRRLFADATQEFQFGSIYFSYSDLKIITPEGHFTLTKKEADLLRFLCLHPNRILKREEILTHVWGKDDFFLGRSMDVYMTKLRRFLKADPSVVLETVHGLGFRFSVPETKA